MSFPLQRLRRMRQSDKHRQLVCESNVSVNSFIQPLFVVPGHGICREIKSLPNNFHLSIDCLIEEAKYVRDLGIPAVLLFGHPESKDEAASSAYDPHGTVQEAVRALKRQVPELLVITDVCLCEHTPHGDCGVRKDGYLLNDASVELMVRTTVSHAEAGSDMVAPAAMLDGQVRAMREALDSSGFISTAIMAYSAKFASKLYDPFRKEAAQSSLAPIDKRTHQMDVHNADEAMREIALDIEEGADIVMIKPALFYLDVVYRAKQQFKFPLAVYNVSGEYAMIDAAAKAGRLDRDAVMMESLACLRRAGADLLITYSAKRAAELLANKPLAAYAVAS